MTDPDYLREEIRAKVNDSNFRKTHAYYLPKSEAIRDDDGVENAAPEAIRDALNYVSGITKSAKQDNITMDDLN